MRNIAVKGIGATMDRLRQLAEEWHGHHTPEHCKAVDLSRCDIYNALKEGVDDNELRRIILDVDPDLISMEKQQNELF